MIPNSFPEPELIRNPRGRREIAPAKLSLKSRDVSKAEICESIRAPKYVSTLKADPANADALLAKAEEDAKRRMTFYKTLGDVMQ
jgi:hypothetical protein